MPSLGPTYRMPGPAVQPAPVIPKTLTGPFQVDPFTPVGGSGQSGAGVLGTAASQAPGVASREGGGPAPGGETGHTIAQLLAGASGGSFSPGLAVSTPQAQAAQAAQGQADAATPSADVCCPAGWVLLTHKKGGVTCGRAGGQGPPPAPSSSFCGSGGGGSGGGGGGGQCPSGQTLCNGQCQPAGLKCTDGSGGGSTTGTGCQSGADCPSGTYCANGTCTVDPILGQLFGMLGSVLTPPSSGGGGGGYGAPLPQTGPSAYPQQVIDTGTAPTPGFLAQHKGLLILLLVAGVVVFMVRRGGHKGRGHK